MTLGALFDNTGLAGIEWGDKFSTDNSDGDKIEDVSFWHQCLKDDLDDFFNLRLNHRKLRVPLSRIVLDSMSDFRRKVWDALRAIPPGKTLSYKAIAEEVGNPASARAVGGACRENRWLLLIPCHRAVASNGRLGGFSGKRRRLDIKKKLLLLETGKKYDVLNPA